MRAFFIAASCAWLGLAVIFVLAMISAARRPVPAPPEVARPHDQVRSHLPDKPLLEVEEAELTGSVVDV